MPLESSTGGWRVNDGGGDGDDDGYRGGQQSDKDVHSSVNRTADRHEQSNASY